MATDNEGNAGVGKVNVADNMELAVEYGIAAVPTILVFKSGEVVQRLTGYKDKEELQGIIDTHSKA